MPIQSRQFGSGNCYREECSPEEIATVTDISKGKKKLNANSAQVAVDYAFRMDIPDTFRDFSDLTRVSNIASEEPISLHASLSRLAVGSGWFSSGLMFRYSCMAKRENIEIVLRISPAGVINTDERANAKPAPPEQNPVNKMDQHPHCGR